MSTDLKPVTELGVGAETERDVPESLQRLVCLSLSHDAVSTERIGAVAPDDPLVLARDIRTSERITECVILVTCNRVELYASTRTADEDDLETALSTAHEALGSSSDVQEYVGLEAVEHLARVACGLESAALGEDQILGQVTDAFEDAQEANLVGGVLSRVAETAVRVGRQCREETGLGDGEMGYGGVLCSCIEDQLGRQPDRLLMIGAGEMAELAARAVKRRWDTRIDIANRSRNLALTTEDGEYWQLDQLDQPLQSSDAVVTATGAPGPVLTVEHVAYCEPGTPVVDLANPPDLSAETREQSELAVTDLNDLTTRLRTATQSRQEVVPAVEALVDEAIDRLVAAERESRAEDTLRRLHRKAAQIREGEVERARTRLKSSEEVEVVLSEFANALTGQLLADPTEALRGAARNGDTETITAAERLFELEGGDGE